MGHRLSLAATALAATLVSAALHAAPVTINGATFDAPSTCQAADGALVCKVDDLQLELWVKRRPLAPDVQPTDTFVRKMAFFHRLHDAAVTSIVRATANDRSKATPFSNYGNYSALGSAMPGSGAVTSPTVRFASVLHDNEVWEFLEVVAARTPAVEALSAELQRSLVLPVAPPALATATADGKPAGAEPTVPPPPRPDPGIPLVATFVSKLLSFEHPGYLEPAVAEDTNEALRVTFRHRTRPAAGPNLVVTLRAPVDQKTASVVARERRQLVLSTMAGSTAAVDVNKLGSFDGFGFALIGVPDPRKSLSGIESLETTFVGDVAGRVLEVRVTSEQQYSPEARVVWATIAQSIKRLSF
jgi:hypothetical protein